MYIVFKQILNYSARKFIHYVNDGRFIYVNDCRQCIAQYIVLELVLHL